MPTGASSACATTHATVDLLTCYGEPVERIETADPRAIRFLREHPDARP